MPEAGPEIPKVDELVGEEVEGAGRFGRLIAIAVVLTTLIGAPVAYAQASALRTHDAAAYRAERWGALALNAAAVNRGNAEAQVDRFNLLTQQVRQANTATLFGQYGSKTQANTLMAARWNTIAGQTESDTAAIAASQESRTSALPQSRRVALRRTPSTARNRIRSSRTATSSSRSGRPTSSPRCVRAPTSRLTTPRPSSCTTRLP